MSLETKYHAFIAYASPDRPYAKSLYEILREDYEVFFDWESLLPGDPWDVVLPRSQANSLVTIVLISSNVDKAYYQNEEIASAIALSRDPQSKHRLIPIFLDSAVKTEDVPYGLRRLHSIHLRDDFTIEKAARQIARSLRKMPHAEVDKRSPLAIHEERLKAIAAAEEGRERFRASVDAIIQSRRNMHERFCMIYIDLDGFSGLNKRFGISVGNEVIKTVGNIVAEICDAQLTTRWGGDSFLVFLRKMKSSAAIEIAETIRKSVHYYDWDSVAPRLYVNASLGVAERIDEINSTDFIFRTKEGARAAKRAGGNRVASAPKFLGVSFRRFVESYDFIDS